MNPVSTNELNQLCRKFEHLNHISFPNVDDNKVSLIIGIDSLELVHYSKVIKSPKNTRPWAVETPLVWTCAGKNSDTADKRNPVFKTQINSHLHLDNEFFTKVQQWMKIKNYGIASPKKAMSKNGEKALLILESTTKFSDGHYEIGLLWKENANLPKNRWLAEKELKQLNKMLSTKPDLQNKYDETLKKDLQIDSVVKVDPATDIEPACSYLFQHPVSNDNTPGKVRRVTNASSDFQGQSLN